MELEMYVILLMFAVAGAGLIAAINSHGVVRTVLSYVLAGAILILGVFTLVTYNSEKLGKELAKKEAQLAEKARQDEILRQQKAEEEAKAAAALAAQANAGNTQTGAFQQDLVKLAEKGLNIARGVLSANVEGELSDDAFEALKKKAGGYKGGAAGLKKELDALMATAPAGTDVSAAKEAMEKAIRELNAATAKLVRFFNAEGAEEEKECIDAFQSNGRAAKADFTRAIEKLSGK